MSEITKSLQEIIINSVKNTFNEIDENTLSTLVMVEIPKDKVHGDYSTNIAMRLTKILHKDPMSIASPIVEKLKESEVFDNVELVRPGFINLFLNIDSLSRVIK